MNILPTIHLGISSYIIDFNQKNQQFYYLSFGKEDIAYCNEIKKVRGLFQAEKDIMKFIFAQNDCRVKAEEVLSLLKRYMEQKSEVVGNFMKKNIEISRRRRSLLSALIIGFVFILVLSGCSFPLKKKADPLLQSDYLNHDIEYKDPDDKECLRVLVRLLQAVDQKDRETIKGMFSKEALNHIDDIDEKIDLFIETFPTWECKYDPSFGGMGKHANKGTITKWIKPTFDFESEGRQYVLRFIYYTEADENADQMGLSMIQIYERSAPGYSEDFEAQSEDSPHDIYLWDYTMDLKDRKPLLQTTPFGVYEKTDEEKAAYLATMTSEEANMIVQSEHLEAYYSKKLYSHQINNYYVALKELRFAYDYIEKNSAKDRVVFEGVQVNYFDQALLSDKEPDSVLFHLADDETENQMGINLEVNGDEVTVLNEDMVLEYIQG